MKKGRKGLYKRHIKSRWSRGLAGILCISLILMAFADISFVKPKQVQAEVQTNVLTNPRIVKDDSMEAGQKVTWDCIWFGSYPQAEVVPSSKEYTALNKGLIRDGDLIKDDMIYQKLKVAVDWDAQGDITIDGEKYRRIRKEDAETTAEGQGCYQWENGREYHYFKYESLKWRVLSVENSEVFLIADQALDAHRPNKAYAIDEDMIWDKNTMRSWLNGYGAGFNQSKIDYRDNNFIQTAFNQSEQSKIKSTYVENKANPSFNIKDGKNTLDKIFLLSDEEVFTDTAEKYGFVSDYDIYDEARRAKSSLYAKAMGVTGYLGREDVGDCDWWLRSPSEYCSISYVNVNGYVCKGYHDYISDDPHYGVRPALNLSLAVSSETGSLWSYAGTVCSDGTVKEEEPEKKKFLSNPRIVKDDSMAAGQKVTWDCIWFGSYPQAEIVPSNEEYTALDKELVQNGDLIKDDKLYEKLKVVEGWDAQGDIVINGEKYRRIKEDTETDVSSDYQYQWGKNYHYFKYQPIKWRVLEINDAGILLMADKVLDDKQYHTKFDDVTWENCTIRSWLNGYNASANKQNMDYSKSNFISIAFSKLEQSVIKNTSVENSNNLKYNTNGGNNTNDMLFLLSESEVYTNNANKYGFISIERKDEGRVATPSLYAKAQGTISAISGLLQNEIVCTWGLRTPGYDNCNIASVFCDGRVATDYYDTISGNGVRPALNLNLAVLSDVGSDNLWSYAGTVCSDGTVNEVTKFDKYIYRANLLLSHDYAGSKTLEEYLSRDTPSKIMVRELQKNGFGDTATAWKSLTSVCDSALDAGKVIDIAMEEKDIYSAIILNAMESAAEYSLVDTINVDAIKDSEELLSIIKEGLKLKYDLEVDKETKNSMLTEEMRKRVKELAGEYYEEKGFSKVVSWLGKFEEVMKYVETIEDFCQEVASYINLRNMNDSMKEILKEMCTSCPVDNKALQAALNDCVKILDISDDEFMEQMIHGGLRLAGKETAKAAISWFWEKVLIKKIEETWPDLAIIKIAYKGSKYVTTSLFNVDELTEKYFKMVAVTEVSSLIKNTCYSLKNRYRRERNTDNAQIFLSAVDVFFNALTYDCESAYAYVDELSSANLTRLCALFGGDDGSSLKETINDSKSLSYQQYEAIVLRDWVNYLEEDYPYEYPYYSYLIEESMERIKEYKIHCPVDVYVYDSGNNPVASVVDDIPSANGLTVVVEHSEKTVYIPEGEEYTFKYIGNDTGYMDINITEYDKKGSIVRNVYFNDLELAKGLTYISLEDGKIAENKKYQISAEEEKNLEADFDTLFSKNKQVYSIKIYQGTIYQNKEPYYITDAYAGEVLDISAFVPAGYKFDQWEIISGKAKIEDVKERNTTIKVLESDVGIKAAFRKISDEEGEVTARPDYTYIPSIVPVSSAVPTVMPTNPVASVIPTPAATQKVPDDTDKLLPTPTVVPKPTVVPQPVITPAPATEENNKKKSVRKLKKGSKIIDKKTKAVYKITSLGKNKTAEYVRSTKKNAASISVPSVVKLGGKNFKVTSVGKSAFKDNKKLQRVRLGNNIKLIGKQAFSGCKKLRNITIGAKVTAIEANAFSRCANLTMITIPSKVKKIGAKAFYQCKNLRYIMIKTKKLTLDTVGKNAFGGGYHSPRVKTGKNIWKQYSVILLQRGISKKALFIINPVKLVI